ETGSAILSKAVQSLLSNSESQANKSQVLNLLKNAEIVPKNATVENWLAQSLKQHGNLSNASTKQPVSQLVQQVLASSPSDAQQTVKQVQTWINNQPTISEAQKAQLQQLVSRFEALPKNPATIEMFAKQLHEQVVKAFAEQTSQPSSNDPMSKEQLLSLIKPEAGNPQATQSALLNLVKLAGEANTSFIQTMQSQADAQTLSALDGKMMEQAIKTVLKGLGMSYEASLNSKQVDMQELTQSLKPQLLSLIQDAQTPPALREAADTIVSRLNGMQLTSGENGHQHQLVMQVPLQFLGKKTEATVQWNGRMKENGKIDANYARVLFYLNMEALEETMVDMQVQNRIITINLYNNQPQLETLAEPLKEALKKGLSDKNYQLSGLFVKPFKNTPASKPNSVTKGDESKLNSGVDIRI
ncbi:MAG TPA: hypothetical protein VNQ57_00610, partial [Ureibacillus sp.]|nr:hypothetical protein [Ureibacillus sp.]